MDQAFSQKNVNNSVTEEYSHAIVTIEPSEMELEKAEAARQAAIAEEEAAKERARKEQEKLKRKGSKNSQITSQDGAEDKTEADADKEEDSKKGSEKDEAEEGEDDEEMFAFRVFFRKEEITMANEMQERD